MGRFFHCTPSRAGGGLLASSDQIALGFIGLGQQSGGLRGPFFRNDAEANRLRSRPVRKEWSA